MGNRTVMFCDRCGMDDTPSGVGADNVRKIKILVEAQGGIPFNIIEHDPIDMCIDCAGELHKAVMRWTTPATKPIRNLAR